MWRYLGTAIKGILFLLGLAGLITLPEDAQKWAELMGPLAEYVALSRAEFALFAIIAVFGLWILFPAATPLIREIRLFFKQQDDETQISTLRASKTLEDHSKQECLDRLSHKMEDGLKLLNRPVTTEQEFVVCKIDNDKWINDIFDEIERFFGRPHAVTFRSVISVTAADFPPSFNPEHNTLKLHLDKRIKNLGSFLNKQSDS